MRYLLLIGLLLSATLSQAQDATNAFTVPPGIIVWRVHDPDYTPTNQIANDSMALMSRYMKEWSYGRNEIKWVVTNDLSAFCFCNRDERRPGFLDYSIKMLCPEYNRPSGWGMVMFHEGSHCFGQIGEGNGAKINADGSMQIVGYGDRYDVMNNSAVQRPWNAHYKAGMGMLGPSGARGCVAATATGVFELTDYESQSPGNKAVKVLQKHVLYDFNGPYYDVRNFYYFEMRNNLSMGLQTTGKGRHRVTKEVFGPGVLFHMGQMTYNFKTYQFRIESSYLRLDKGKNGVLVLGDKVSDVQRTYGIDSWNGGVTNSATSRGFSMEVVGLTTNGCSVKVEFN